VLNTGRFDIDKLEDQSLNNQFSNKIKKILQEKEVVADADVDRNWEQIRSAINNVMATILGKKNLKTKPWFNRVCEEAIERRVARMNWLNDTNNDTHYFGRYKTRLREASNILRCEKKKYLQDMLEKAELDYKSHKTRDMYKQINRFAGGYKKKERFLKNYDGILITSSEEIFKIWGKYFDKVLNCDEPDEVFSFDLKSWNKQDCPEQRWKR
jgi:hypothetical protein